VIWSVRTDELSSVFFLWQETSVTPAVTDSIEGAAGKPKYWLTFLDRVEHHDDGVTARQGAGRVSGQSDEIA
jgi:hypothetical protein